MTIERFIEKAIAGGWKPDFMQDVEGNDNDKVLYFYENGELRAWVYWAVLQPETWKAVGKVEGWGERKTITLTGGVTSTTTSTDYLEHMHRLIDALAEGKTITQYIESL